MENKNGERMINAKLRTVTIEDCQLLYEWANEEYCRRNSFCQNKILLEEHIQWFQQQLENNDTYMYIYEFENIEIGQIRVNCKGKEATISYSIDHEYRLMGHAKVMLGLLEKELRKKNIDVELIGLVKENNIASQKVFEQLGYEKIVEKDYLKYKKALSNSIALDLSQLKIKKGG